MYAPCTTLPGKISDGVPYQTLRGTTTYVVLPPTTRKHCANNPSFRKYRLGLSATGPQPPDTTRCQHEGHGL